MPVKKAHSFTAWAFCFVPHSTRRLMRKRKKHDSWWASVVQQARNDAEHNRTERAKRKLVSEGFLKTAIARGGRGKPAADFYQSRDWLSVRYAALLSSGGRCACCGASSSQGATLHVDHIKPRSLFPSLALDLKNLQVLCAECNIAKSNIDMTDWRSDDAKKFIAIDDGGKRVFRIKD